MSQPRARVYACGVRCILWPEAQASEAIAYAAQTFSGMTPSLLLVFAAPSTDPVSLRQALDAFFPAVQYIACSTAGEIGPDGYAEGSIVALALPSERFHVTLGAFEGLPFADFSTIVRDVESLREQHNLSPPAAFAGAATFGLSFVDGLSRREELFVSAIHRALDGIPVIGGSSGDNLAFQQTWCVANGQILQNAGVLALVRTNQRFSVFRHDNFEPTDIRLVVTDCDQETRTVRELNAAPAALEYACCLGVAPESLDSHSFASHPVVVKVGGEYYCRSIGYVNPDRSLTFFCAMEKGIVLTVAHSKHIVESARAAFQAVTSEIGGSDFVLGFDCALRKLDAENRQMKRQLSDVYRDYGVIGFNTFGEQFEAMHLNQTFTGLAIGAGG